MLGAALGSCFFVGQAKADTSQLFISQVQITGGTGHSDDDFVELFNPNASPVNLNGYVLAKRTANTAKDSLVYSWSSDIFVPAYGFYLWANSGFAGISSAPDTSSTSTLSNDSSVVLRLGALDTGTIIDSLSWGTTNNGLPVSTYGNPSAGKALQRQDLFSATSIFITAASGPHNSQSPSVDPSAPDNSGQQSSVDNSSNQQATTTIDSQSATSSAKSYLVKIYRFLPNPVGDDPGNEWVELKNNDSQDVALDGWILDDKNTGSGPATDAYILSGSIVAGEVKRFVLPAAVFALNNTGGDEVNLYFSDKTLADSAVYTVTAYDNGIFEFRDGAWQPPVQTTSGGGGSYSSASTPSTAATQAATSTSTSFIQITEFLPNPVGDDVGKEWIELYNSGNGTTSLAGWKLDDGSVGSSAFIFNADYNIGPKSFLVITIPSGKFVLNNSGSDAARLFNSSGALLQDVAYKDAPEGQSFAVDEAGKWSFGAPTPNEENIYSLPLASIVISELLPNPAGDDEEFLELKNISTTSAVSLAGLKLLIGSKAKVFTDTLLATSSYLVLYGDDLPAKLRNSGQEIKLVDSLGRIVSSVTYDKAPVGQSYNSIGNDWAWSESPTPGADNQVVLAAATSDIKEVTLKPTAKPKITSAPVSANSGKQLQQQVEQLAMQVQSLQNQLNNPASPAAPAFAPAVIQKTDPLAAIALSLAALALLIVVAKYFLSANKIN